MATEYDSAGKVPPAKDAYWASVGYDAAARWTPDQRERYADQMKQAYAESESGH